MTEAKKAKDIVMRDSARVDESVEAHRILDTGELREEEDVSVEGHAVNHRPLDNATGNDAR